MKKISFEDACILSAIKFARFWARILPLSVSFWIARRIGSFFFYLTKRRKVAYKNLRMVFSAEKNPGELLAIAKRSMQNMAMNAIEMLRIPEMSREDVGKNFVIQGRENFEPHLKKGAGVIFLTGHFGNWELLNVISGILEYSVVVLARVQKHPKSDAYLNSLRRSKGNQVIHKGMPIREILKALKRGDIVGILSDQDGGKQGCFVNFFNRLSSTPPGAAAFSLRTGSPICPIFIIREKNGSSHRIVIEKPIPVPDASLPPEEAERCMIQDFSSSLERRVREFPEQWLWAHRRWKSSPDRHILILSDGKAGHLNQSQAVLAAIQSERKSHGRYEDRIYSKIIQPRFKKSFAAKSMRILSMALRGHLPFRRAWMKWCLEEESYKEMMATYADVVISCGASLVDVNLWVKNENYSKSVVVMKPSLPVFHFDAVVAPKHDGLNRSQPQVFETEGALSPIQSEDLETEGAVLAAELGLSSKKRRAGVLIGGDTGALHFDPGLFSSLTKSIHDFCKASGFSALVTTSRRTPAWADENVKKVFEKKEICPFYVIANESNRKGIVAGIMALSDVLVVTADSISMISEAVSAGKPVIAVDVWQGEKLKKKYQNYLRHLENMNFVIRCRAENIKQALEKYLSSGWTVSTDYRRQEEMVLSKAVRRVI